MDFIYENDWRDSMCGFGNLLLLEPGAERWYLRPVATPHKSCSVKTYLTDLTAFREENLLLSLAIVHIGIGKFPCGLLRTKKHHFTIAPFP